MISKRLKLIASLIGEQQSVLDIGCDHGYLAKQLRDNGNKARIICSDNKIGPLNNANNNLQSYENIDFVLSDGAKRITDPVDVAVMSGMGYHTVIAILSQSEAYFEKVKQLIIQVNTNVPDMRQWLADHHYRISDEQIIRDYKYYEILIVEHGDMELTDTQKQFGLYLPLQGSDTYRDYLRFCIRREQKILADIDPSNQDYESVRLKLAGEEQMLKSISDNS